MASRTCWHCGVRAGMELVGKPQRSKMEVDDPAFWFALMRCNECGWPSICLLEWDNVGNDPVESFKAEERYLPHTWLPLRPMGKEYEDVPKDIASAASEAYSCFSINANRAAVLMARTAIEATAKDKQITGVDLYHKIGAMADKNIITGQLAEEAHEIRLLGNDMAHGDLAEPVTEEDASDILGFLDSVMDYVYQQPMLLQKRKELRERRKQAKQTEQSTDTIA